MNIKELRAKAQSFCNTLTLGLSPGLMIIGLLRALALNLF